MSSSNRESGIAERGGLEASRLELAHLLSRDDDAHDLGRAAAHLEHLGIAEVALNRVVGGVAGATQYVHGHVADPGAFLGGEQLGNRRFLACRESLVLEPCSVIQKVGGNLDSGGHVGDVELDCLVLADRPAELHAFLGVGDSLLHCDLHQAESLRANTDSSDFQRRERQGHALVDLAEDGLFADPAVLKEVFGRGRRGRAHLVLDLAHLEARIVIVNDETSESRSLHVCLCEQHMRVPDDAVGDVGDPAGVRRSGECKYLPNLRYSKFNPHLAEVVVRYWSLSGGLVVDPFAGRSTRGVVSVALGRHYVGYEVVPEVADSVRSNCLRASSVGIATIIHNSDGCEMKFTPDGTADLVFTCPPYHRQEKYTSCPNQLSDIKDYGAYLRAIRRVAFNINRVLKINGFLVWVCADWRDGKAFRLFHKDSIDIFCSVGLVVHDIVIVENISPFASLQAGKVAAKRYTSKVHEYLIVCRQGSDGRGGGAK